MSAISGYQSAISLEQLQVEAASPAEVLEKVLEALQTAGISVDEMTNPDELRAALAEVLGEFDFDAATPAEVLAAVESALDARGLSLTNIVGAAASPAEVADAIAAALPDIAQAAQTAAEAAIAAKDLADRSDLGVVNDNVLAVKAAVEELGIPTVPEGLATKSDLDAVHSDVLATKAAVEGIEIPAGLSSEDVTDAARAAIVAEEVATSSDVAAVKAVVDELDPLDKAETIDAVETAIDNKNLPNRTDLQAVADLVSQVKTLVEGLETGSGGGGVDPEDVQAAVEAALEDRNLSLADIADIAASPTEVQTVIESVLQGWQPPSAGPLPGEVRMFLATEVPEGWEQVQGPVYDLAPGGAMRIPSAIPVISQLVGSIGPLSAATEGGKLYVYGAAYEVLDGLLLEYDSDTRTWTGLSTPPALGTARAPMVGLGDGRLFVAGGVTLAEIEPDFWDFIDSDETWIYDLDTGTWASAAPLPAGRYDGGALLRLSSGKVLSYSYDPFNGNTALYEYDPVTNSWVTKASVWAPSYYSAAALLPSGKVLFVDSDVDGYLGYAVYDPVEDEFSIAKTITAIPAESAGLIAAFPDALGALIYRQYDCFAYVEDTDTWVPVAGAIPIPWMNPVSSVLVPGVGIFESDQEMIPIGSVPSAIRYARKL